MTLSLDPSALFHSISDPSRLRLLRLLSRHELNVQELVRITELSQPRVSRHLSILREQGWLEQRREGTWSWYHATDPAAFGAGAALFREVTAAADRIPQAADDDRRLAVALADRRRQSRDFFSGIADRWDEIRSEYEHPDIRVGTLGALVEPALSVLDIGTGTGALLPVFAGAAASVVALDNSEAMLARARARCRAEDLDYVRFCTGDVAHLPFAAGTFDACNCSMVLHHVPHPGAAVAEMARVVKPGGRVMVTAFLSHDQEWMRDELAHQWLGFSRREIEVFFREAGLWPRSHLVRGRLADEGSVRSRPGPDGKPLAWPEVFLAVGIKESGILR